VRSLEHLIQLQVLDLQLFGDCSDLLLQDEIGESFALLDGVDGVVEDFEQLLPFSFLVLVVLHLDLILVLQVPKFALLSVDVSLDGRLLLDDLVLLDQLFPVFPYLLLEYVVGLHQLLPFLLDLGQQPLVLVLFLMQLLDFVLELLDEIEVGGCYFGVVGLDIRVFLGVLGSQLLYLVVLLVLELLDQVFAEILHLVAHLLHLQVVFLLQVIGPSLEFLPQLSLPLVIFSLEGKGIVLLRELLLFE
jgi:hypothetical protein